MKYKTGVFSKFSRGKYYQTYKHEVAFKNWLNRAFENKQVGLSNKLKIRKLRGLLGVPDFIVYHTHSYHGQEAPRPYNRWNYTFVEVKYRAQMVKNPLKLLSPDQYRFFIDFKDKCALFVKIGTPKKKVFFYAFESDDHPSPNPSSQLDELLYYEVDPVQKIMCNDNMIDDPADLAINNAL